MALLFAGTETFRGPAATVSRSTAFQLSHERQPDRALLVDKGGRLRWGPDAHRDAELGEALFDDGRFERLVKTLVQAAHDRFRSFCRCSQAHETDCRHAVQRLSDSGH